MMPRPASQLDCHQKHIPPSKTAADGVQVLRNVPGAGLRRATLPSKVGRIYVCEEWDAFPPHAAAGLRARWRGEAKVVRMRG